MTQLAKLSINHGSPRTDDLYDPYDLIPLHDLHISRQIDLFPI